MRAPAGPVPGRCRRVGARAEPGGLRLLGEQRGQRAGQRVDLVGVQRRPVGELGLDGAIRPVRGVLSVARLAAGLGELTLPAYAFYGIEDEA